jgi:hypothetical protein
VWPARCRWALAAGWGRRASRAAAARLPVPLPVAVPRRLKLNKIRTVHMGEYSFISEPTLTWLGLWRD